MAVPRLRWASPGRSAPEPTWLAGTSPAPTNTGRPAGMPSAVAAVARSGPATSVAAAIRGSRSRSTPNRSQSTGSQDVADAVREAICGRAGPIRHDAARQPCQHGLLAVEEPSGLVPGLRALLLQPEDAGHDVLGGDHAAGCLELALGWYPVGESSGLRSRPLVEPAEHVTDRLARVIDGLEAEHLGGEHHARQASWVDAGVAHELPGSGRDGIADSDGILLHPARPEA